MRQETKAFLGIVANKRCEALRKKHPQAQVVAAIDDSGMRAAVSVTEGEQLLYMEFIESAETAGRPDYLEDYVEVARALGSLTILFPEAKYIREMAQPIFQSILAHVRLQAGDFAFNGYIYDERGALKKAL
ncbi:MAG: hypothetical protein WCK39_09760 [Methanomassiliicoccales archaeon]